MAFSTQVKGIMAFPFLPSNKPKPFTAKGFIDKAKSVFMGLPDGRKTATANNIKYSVEDAALSAFSVFFTQSPSFLDYQIRMEKVHGKNNAQSIFGIHKIPSANQIRNILDPIPPETIFPLIQDIGNNLYQHGYLEPFRSIGGTLLVAMDGTDFFSSEKISCPYCSCQTLKNGHILYRHSAITPVIVAPEQSQVIPLPPEFIQPQDGTAKQDCELAAGKRWLNIWSDHYAPWHLTILGDDLYCHQPFCEEALLKGLHVLFVCKPDSHVLLYEWIADFERTGQLYTIERIRWNGKQRLTERYRYINQVPLRNSDDALMLNWCELTITDELGKVIYKNAWATSHAIDDKTVISIASAGRARWKIENENNNVLKNQGYHFDHNFGHGKQHLSNLLATLMILAYLFHTTLDWVDIAYRTVRSLLPSRRTFFEHLRALMQYLPFDNWDALMKFMLNGLGATILDSG